MPLTGTEMSLIGVIIGIVGVSGGKIWGSVRSVSPKICKLQHEALEKLLEEKFENLSRAIGRLEKKICSKRSD